MNRHTSFFDFPERLHSWQKLLPYAVLLSVTLAVYGATAYFHFVWDDVYYIGRNFHIQELSLERLRTIWSGTYLGHYAPVHLTFLALLFSVSGFEPFGYHVAQLLVHAACLCLLYHLLSRMESPRIAFLASLLFALYPPNIETVAWISESKSTLAFLFFLISFWFFLRLRETGKWNYGLWCGFFLLLSLLSKINTVVAPAIFLLWDYRQGSLTKERVRSLAIFFLISAAFVGIHLTSFYGSAEVDGATYYGSLWVHLMNLPRFVWFYIRMVAFPYPLSAWRMFPIHDSWNAVLVGAWAASLGLLWLLSRGDRAVRFWGLWFLVFLAPVLQLFPFGIWVADRYLYIPAIGAFVLAGMGFFWIRERFANWSAAWGLDLVMGSVLLLFSWSVSAHLPVWRNNVTLWDATTPGCDTSAYCHVSLGAALLEDGQTERGIRELIRGVELRDAIGYLSQLGDAYANFAHDYRQALVAYNAALSKTPVPAQAPHYARISRMYVLAGDFHQARRALEAGMEINSQEPTVWVVKTFLAWKEGNLAEARESLEQALRLGGNPPDISAYLYVIWGKAADVGRLLSVLRDAAG
jgi:hypothetical protein